MVHDIEFGDALTVIPHSPFGTSQIMVLFSHGTQENSNHKCLAIKTSVAIAMTHRGPAIGSWWSLVGKRFRSAAIVFLPTIQVAF
jgi:hypothetical protein